MNTAKEFLLRYLRYNVWANKRIAAVLDQLDETKYDETITSSFPSIRKTVFHLMDAEYIWLMRLQGQSLSKGFSDSLPAGTKPSYYPEVSEKFLRFIEEKGEAYFAAVIDYRNLKGDAFSSTVAEIVMHCMNHSTFHRGQLVTMIRQAGWNEKLPSTDMITYFREM